MDFLFYLLLFAGAILAGLLGAMLGVGGGLIIVPLLNLVFGIPLNKASGASLIAVIVTSSAGSTYYVERKIVNLRLAMLLEVGTVTGAIFGAFLSALLAPLVLGQVILRILLGVILIYAAYYLTIRGKGGNGEITPHQARTGGVMEDIPGTYNDEALRKEVSYSARNIPRGLVAAVGSGVVSGLFGIGGGIVKVPAMILMMDVPTKVATATSNFMIGVTGAAGAPIYFVTGNILPGIVAPVTIGVFAGALLGSRISSRVQSVWLKRIFAVVLIATAIELIAKALGVSPF